MIIELWLWKLLVISLLAGGMWVLSDGILSWTLYANAKSYGDGDRQTFKRDHWVRLVRIICGLFFMVLGGMLL